MHKIAALVLAAVAVAFLFATDVTHASSGPRMVGPTGAARMAAARAEAQADAAADATTRPREARPGEARAAAEGTREARAEDALAQAALTQEALAEGTGGEALADHTEAGDVGTARAPQRGDRRDRAARSGRDADAAPASTPTAERAAPFATADGVALHPVSDAVVVTGYHQAGPSARAVTLEPAEAAPPAEQPQDGAPAVTEPTTLTLPSRGRGTAATSAVDLALPAGEPVASPVDGRVRSVEPYRLYGRTGDVIVRIAPADRPDLDVAVLHVDDVRVKPGQRVAAGETIVAATARVLPFASQVERFSGAMPHVHLDVRPAEDPATTA